MNIYELSFPHSLLKDDIPNTVSAIGFFDGIHRGHQKVINEAIRRAEENNMESAVITFHPHPLVVLKDDHHVNYITPLKEKIEILKELAVDRLYIVDFNKEFSKLSPQEFIDQFIIGLNIKHLVAGFDYTFGHKGKGNMKNISEYTRDKFSYTTVEQVSMDEEKVSSTRIRKLLKAGNIDEANELLTRPFKLRGIVIKGDQRGREIGFPTANIQVDKQALLPKPGIYAVKVLFNNETFYGMANIGTNPTFTADREDLSIEVNILDYNNNLYGQELIVEWYKYMREEEKFDSVEALIDQIKLDEVNIRQFFSI